MYILYIYILYIYIYIYVCVIYYIYICIVLCYIICMFSLCVHPESNPNLRGSHLSSTCFLQN